MCGTRNASESDLKLDARDICFFVFFSLYCMGFLKVKYFVVLVHSDIVDIRVIFLCIFNEGRIKTLNELMKSFFVHFF